MGTHPLREVAHVKRLLELLEGDPGFRQAARETPSRHQALLREAGVDLDSSGILPFWKLAGHLDVDGSCQTDLAEGARQHPLGALWAEWLDSRTEQLRSAARLWQPAGDPRFTAWRQRQIARARSEAVTSDDAAIFPVLAFEMSKGCSTQCWFCAFDPPKFAGHFAYSSENRDVWRDLLAAARDLFGAGCGTTLCYHATEPSDNPDYFRFLEDVHHAFGVYPQTTTARPLRDLSWTRTLPRLRGVSDWPHDRFTVLSPAALHAIHRTFTADELLHVDLVFQYPGSFHKTIRSGRLLDRPERAEGETGGAPGTIECVCGFLVNMVDRTLRLISPCAASARWPLGFIVHDEGTFHDASSFRTFVKKSVESGMREHLDSDDRLAFRPDLTCECRTDGFVLTSRVRRHVVQGDPHLAALGRLIDEGTHTTAEVTDRLVLDGMNVLDAIAWQDRLYQRGVLSAV